MGLSLDAAIFVAACAVMVTNQLWRNPGTAAAGVAIIAAGIPVYAWMTRAVRRNRF